MLFKDNCLSSSNGNLPHSDQVVSVAGKEGLEKKRNKWAQMKCYLLTSLKHYILNI